MRAFGESLVAYRPPIDTRSVTHMREIPPNANTGTPIPDDEQAMIFEPFFQGSHQRKGAVKGSGLGLSIARDCIRRMHGELNLVTDDRTDVCFRIELPLKPEKSMK
jgi:two-component system sensor histidine kinase GlrK